MCRLFVVVLKQFAAAFAVFTFAMLSGCNTHVLPVELAPRPATTIAVPIDRAWATVVDVLTEQHLSIRTIDRASGLILLKTVRVPTIATNMGMSRDPHPWADCGKLGDGFYVPTFASYAFRVRSQHQGSAVQMTITYSMARNEMSMAKAPCESRGLLESQIEATIKTRAEVP